MRIASLLLNGFGSLAALAVAGGLFFFFSVIFHEVLPMRILAILIGGAAVLGPAGASLYVAITWPEAGPWRTISVILPSAGILLSLLLVPVLFVLAEAAARP